MRLRSGWRHLPSVLLDRRPHLRQVTAVAITTKHDPSIRARRMTGNIIGKRHRQCLAVCPGNDPYLVRSGHHDVVSRRKRLSTHTKSERHAYPHAPCLCRCRSCPYPNPNHKRHHHSRPHKILHRIVNLLAGPNRSAPPTFATNVRTIAGKLRHNNGGPVIWLGNKCDQLRR